LTNFFGSVFIKRFLTKEPTRLRSGATGLLLIDSDDTLILPCNCDTSHHYLAPLLRSWSLSYPLKVLRFPSLRCAHGQLPLTRCIYFACMIATILYELISSRSCCCFWAACRYAVNLHIMKRGGTNLSPFVPVLGTRDRSDLKVSECTSEISLSRCFIHGPAQTMELHSPAQTME
jgi:hypothetical protein